MTTIWGLWRRDGSPSASREVRRMESALAAYGPDRTACWHNRDGNVAVGGAIALSLPEDDFDRQPLYDGASDTVLIADVRLDNRAELRRELGLSEHVAKGFADVDFLLAAWKRWEEDCVHRLVGEFAFVIWDQRRRRLFCARDPLGRRALHYFDRAPLFAFATFPKGLHALGEVPRRLDEFMLATRLALIPETGDRSFFEGIQRLPPGCVLVVDQANVKVRRYWNPLEARTIRFRRDEEYVQAFQEVLDESVRARLRSRGPIASMLSGGFDSTTVTAVAARLLAGSGRELLAFTGVPSPHFNESAPHGRNGNEGPLAATVAAMYPNVRHTLVPPTDVCPLDLTPTQRTWSETPGSHICMLPNAHAMSEAHRAMGVTVALTGVGGNMTISYNGLPSLAGWIRRGRWLRWQAEARALHRGPQQQSWRRLLALSLAPYVPLPVLQWMQKRNPARFGTLKKFSMINPELMASGTVKALATASNWSTEDRPWMNGRSLRSANLLRVDVGGAASVGRCVSGVDFRDPTTDRRLIEFCLGIPDEQFLGNGQTRWLLRRAMQDRLSPDVLNAPRKGLVGADWYLRVAPYRERFGETVSSLEQSPIARRCLDLRRMRQCIDSWPQRGWNTAAAEAEYRMAFCRGIYVGEFIRWVEAGA
ncbi:MAG TPA: asparagine synthase-related protein [Bryobacteraceae bacterium]|nr:asparagine synthase-related protein [Bryobacteraceae bacterium]